MEGELMSALSVHMAGDCWWPCHYCQVEDELADTNTEDEGGDDD
jgi:hypothetical protein